jgi:predicted GNAT family acetyltransferase
MSEDLTVVRNDREHRYEAQLDGVVIAFSEFLIRPGQVVFTHTKTDPTYEGKGFGSRLAQSALDDVRTRGEKVVPLCPFIKAYIERHPEFGDLVIDGF